MKPRTVFALMLLALAAAAAPVVAQTPVPPPAAGVQLRSATELDQLLGPIALYPDPLIAQILPAATMPSEVVLADRYVSGGNDPNLIDQQDWDTSVKGLARYPAVLKWMDDNLAWTTAVGEAFLNQQQDVMDAIQRLRAQAQALGNLQPSPEENVITDDGTIEIVPADPQVIYVPVYQPDLVFFQRPFHGSFISFGLGLAIGAWLNHDFDWHDHHLIVWRHDQPRPLDWWSRRPSERPRAEFAHAAVWHPRARPGPDTRTVDRGWDTGPARGTRVVSPPERPQRPAAPMAAPHPAPAPRPASGALIGIESSHDARQFSARGQQSRETLSKPSAPAHSEAPARPAAPSRPEAPSRPASPAKR